jgi:hypothetical protein
MNTKFSKSNSKCVHCRIYKHRQNNYQHMSSLEIISKCGANINIELKNI